ncbi:MAG: tetratricopeptide repeat protein [Flavobacteriales bacterium]
MSLKLREQNNDFIRIASLLRELGFIYLENKDYESAVEHFERAFQIYRQVGDKRGIILSTNYMSELHLKQNRFKEALNNALFSHSKTLELGLKELIKRTSLTLFHIYKTIGSAENALKFYKQYVAIKDSLNDESYNKLLIKMKVQKKLDELIAKERETIAAQNEQLKLEDFQNKMMYGGLGILILFRGFAFNRLYITRKQKRVIEKQKKEVETKGNEAEKQRKIAELKNLEILDSIHYARKVQSAILPPEHLIKSNFPNSFIFYKPKDIIAGDFYWLSEKDSYVYLAVADCTDHGVLGVLVSVDCHSALDKVINIFNCNTPSAILNKSRSIIME